MKLLTKQSDLSSSVGGMRSGGTSPNPAAISTPISSSPRSGGPVLVGDLLANTEIKGSGATIFKSEYTDMFFHKSMQNSSNGPYQSQSNPSTSAMGSLHADSNLAKVKPIVVELTFQLPISIFF